MIKTCKLFFSDNPAKKEKSLIDWLIKNQEILFCTCYELIIEAMIC